MNTKSTIIALLLMASLYGQASQANEVTISAGRLANLNGQDIQFMAQNEIISFKNGNAILNMSKLDTLLKSYQITGQEDAASMIRARMIPYGCT